MKNVYITGRGLVTPLGVGLAANEAALRSGKSGVVRFEELAELDVGCAVGGVADEEPPTELIDRKTARSRRRGSPRRTGRSTASPSSAAWPAATTANSTRKPISI